MPYNLSLRILSEKPPSSYDALQSPIHEDYCRKKIEKSFTEKTKTLKKRTIKPYNLGLRFLSRKALHKIQTLPPSLCHLLRDENIS